MYKCNFAMLYAMIPLEAENMGLPLHHSTKQTFVSEFGIGRGPSGLLFQKCRPQKVQESSSLVIEDFKNSMQVDLCLYKAHSLWFCVTMY